ncbi:hypothetical protein FMUAM8_03520 [Nocardia cyriacigeorgica]|uniref:DUF4244 domain-containing protein n=2 Tax=Nocardia cyriacigeorgica TaxID=135487 RepID=H6R9W8_NOCCG|nr:hypothetical protein FMUAM8_03520 [Nocardia cyriacigeorgica]BDU04081.1 hypothetical protein FMUBM48_03440 [Nocardia cyriacigeorgica]CCF61176.1 protein of unknown function [Nocardia cyriacigeorgica GUH-2]
MRIERPARPEIGAVCSIGVHRMRAAGAVMRARLYHLMADDQGMSTAEYAIGTIAAAAFGAVLYAVVTGDSIVDALTKIIDRALNTNV